MAGKLIHIGDHRPQPDYYKQPVPQAEQTGARLFPYRSRNKHLDIGMTGVQQGNIRPEMFHFPEQIHWVTEQLGLKGNEFLLAQRLGQNQKVTNVLANPKGVKPYQHDLRNQVLPHYWRTEEVTDAVVMPGVNYAQLEGIERSDELDYLAANHMGYAINNADCPMIAINDVKGRINASVHGALNCLVDKETGASALENTLNIITEKYKVALEDLRFTVTPGASAASYGMSPEHHAQVKGKIEHKWLGGSQESKKLGGATLFSAGSSGTNTGRLFSTATRGPREGKSSICLNTLIATQLVKLGVKSQQVEMTSYSSSDAGRSISDNSVEGGAHYSGIYREFPNEGQRDRRRNLTVAKFSKYRGKKRRRQRALAQSRMAA